MGTITWRPLMGWNQWWLGLGFQLSSSLSFKIKPNEFICEPNLELNWKGLHGPELIVKLNPMGLKGFFTMF